MSEMIIRSEHMHEARKRYGGYCVRGLDLWFKRNDMTLRHFLQHGYPESRIVATKDQFGLKVVEVAHDMEKTK